MIPAIVTDELSDSPETAFELGLEWGVRHFELRGMHDARVPRLSPTQRRRLLRAIDAFNVHISAISPGLFKIPFPLEGPKTSNLAWMDQEFHDAWSNAEALLNEHVERLLPESLDFAVAVGAQHLIAFSFHRGGQPSGPAPAQVVEVLARAAEMARSAGMSLIIENEEGHWANTGAHSAALIAATGAPLGLNWDPANALIDGDLPWPEGYGACRHLVRNVHFKDARVHRDGTWELLARGDVDWAGQIRALKVDDYRGCVAMEPHLWPSVTSVRSSLARFNALKNM
ncbi:sugar phosphate isomerase/epimerase family protein [Rhizobium sp. LC145]|uniref:sugar phosphate isomerase/epimerase family protein n=1 Tax=Rhizobium sp. LC145 TaxID=1120688 RepID=UPI00069A2F07|nr:sugar phosphate isomerase/epimerase family protein [Rhizobium sp. LC145]TKT55081.1 sugar phosphate isomerase/epimerase [Rhizobiaceae bacterium LC148]